MPGNDAEGPTLDLALINASQLESVSELADPKTLGEKDRVEIDRLKAEVQSLKQDMDERKKYSRYIFWTCAGWLVGIFFLLTADGIGWHFRLSDSVLLAAIGSTTANVLGIFYIVARYLFPKRSL